MNFTVHLGYLKNGTGVIRVELVTAKDLFLSMDPSKDDSSSYGMGTAINSRPHPAK